MAYVNEMMPNEDIEKYSVKEKMKFFYGGHWAIDRDRGMWLMVDYKSTEGDYGEGKVLSTNWYFYYKDYLIFIKTKEIERKYNEEKKELYIHIRALRMYCRRLMGLY
ncbi:MAG: hypothetical protein LBG67_05220, partial [Campylobacteraceae bacterium]|nr:hypothetical protein [Campylobacteraceae bacterium]